MRRSSDFAAVVRRGGSVRRGCVIVHQLDGMTDVSIVGLVVGKSVGNSVVRHAVSRRLRAQLAARLPELPATSATVVRALPPAATADSAELGRDLDAAFAKLRARARARS
jgi:ribonuclease P protein component